MESSVCLRVANASQISLTLLWTVGLMIEISFYSVVLPVRPMGFLSARPASIGALKRLSAKIVISLATRPRLGTKFGLPVETS